MTGIDTRRLALMFALSVAACSAGYSGPRVLERNKPDSAVNANDVGMGVEAVDVFVWPPPDVEEGRDGSSLPEPTCTAPSVDGGAVPYFECASEPVCPRGRVRYEGLRPGFRVTYLQIMLPTALSSMAIGSVINPPLARGTGLWGISIDVATQTYRTGALDPSFRRGTTGVGLMDGRYAFVGGDGGRYRPSGGVITFDRNRVSTSIATTTTNIPLTMEPGAPLPLELALDNLQMTGVELTLGHGCIGLGIPSGSRYTETTGRWSTEDNAGTPSGTIDADITVENARSANITIGGNSTPLCDIISGARCGIDHQDNWPRPPDATVNGMPAWHFRARFAAISADIAE